jgi:hypothetical protein
MNFIPKGDKNATLYNNKFIKNKIKPIQYMIQNIYFKYFLSPFPYTYQNTFK